MSRELRTTLAIMAVALIVGAPLIFAGPEGVNSFETDLHEQFRCEPDGHGAGGHWPSLADDRPGVKGPLRRLTPLTPARPPAPQPLSPLPQPTFAAAGVAG